MSAFSSMKIAGLVLLGLLPHLASAITRIEAANHALVHEAIEGVAATELRYTGKNKKFCQDKTKPFHETTNPVIEKWVVTNTEKLGAQTERVLNKSVTIKEVPSPGRDQNLAEVTITGTFFLLRHFKLVRTDEEKAEEETDATFRQQMADRFPKATRVVYKKLWHAKVDENTAKENMTIKVTFAPGHHNLPGGMTRIKQTIKIDGDLSLAADGAKTGARPVTALQQARIDRFPGNSGHKAKYQPAECDKCDTCIGHPIKLHGNDGDKISYYDCILQKAFLDVPIDGKLKSLGGNHTGDQSEADLKKESAEFDAVSRRRLGWKPSHDIPRRREGFHHSFVNRVLRESERQS